MARMKNKRILIADDEESIRLTFTDFLQADGYTVFAVKSLSECIKSLEELAFDALFLDVNMGDENSIETIQKIKQIQPDCEIVMMTGGGVNSEYIAKSRRYGAGDYIVKPIRQPSLLYTAQKAVNR